MQSSTPRFADFWKLVMAFLLGVFLSVPALAADHIEDPFSRLQQLADAENKGDMATLAAGTAPSFSVIDEFPPYSWSGPTAFKDYERDNAALAQKAGITDALFTMAPRPLTEEVHGTTAYIVVSGVYSYKQNGKPVRESGIFIATLEKSDQDWRVTSAAWGRL
jgi:hypothetical protein